MSGPNPSPSGHTKAGTPSSATTGLKKGSSESMALKREKKSLKLIQPKQKNSKSANIEEEKKSKDKTKSKEETKSRDESKSKEETKSRDKTKSTDETKGKDKKKSADETKSKGPKEQTAETKSKKEKDPPLVAQAKKRSKQRESLSWKDSLGKKEQEKLLSKDAVVPSNTSKFQGEMLKVHNSYRADHGAPSLKMSRELNREAQEKAEAYVAHKTTDRNLFGENVFTTTFTDSFKSVPSALQVCSEWYEYATTFNYMYQAKFPPKALQFMQLVWESEREMGAGRATNGSGMTVVVALYRPKAELPWSIRQNVKPPLVLTDGCPQHEHVPYKSEDHPGQPILTVKHRTA